MKQAVTLLTLAFFSGCSRSLPPPDPITLDELTVEVFESSREIGYTNKEAGFYYTETNGDQTTGWQGWHVMSKKILDDYAIAVDGKALSRSSVHLSLCSPHQFTRAYGNGVQETVTLLDSVDALVIELGKIRGAQVALRPVWSGSGNTDEFVVHHDKKSAFIARKAHQRRTAGDNYPPWIGITVAGENIVIDTLSLTSGLPYAPVSVAAAPVNGNAVCFIVAGDTREDAETLLDRVSRSYRAMIEARKARMEGVLRQAFVRTDNQRFDRALHWAILSLDALIMNQGKKGIFAGLPWFSNYWGRDSFISLPGATLVTGRFSDAKAILRSFAEWQNKDASSPMMGRIPNLVTPSSISYNTTDGTAWFVIALGDYVTSSGDTAFARELFPVVRRSVEGALRHRTEKNLLMTHEDAETWMDAVGPEGPWTPRGNRANDIQALWYKQLLVASWMAEMLGETSSFRTWFSAAEQLRNSFNTLFVNSEDGLVYDHLNSDGSPDRQFRPNQILTLDLIDDARVQLNIFRKVTERLVYPYGVGSLSDEDDQFHPFHHYAPSYVQDAAYHNGIVWTWLAGPWITAATRFGYADLSFRVTEDMVHQILDRGAVGTLSELLDAAARDGEPEPRLSGTFTQAWSLAEFVRVWYQDYLGISVDAVEHKVELHPHLPSAIAQARFGIPLGGTTIAATYKNERSRGIITLVSPPTAPTADFLVGWRLETGVTFDFAYTLLPGTEATLTIDADGVSVKDASGERLNTMTMSRLNEKHDSLSLATAKVRPDLPSMKGPSHRILTNEEIKRSAAGAVSLYEAVDPTGDDRGPGTFVYPANPYFKPGILDLTKFSVSADAQAVHFSLTFRSLVNPGWHPEYGFQLTYAAIAVDKDGVSGSGNTVIGRNSGYQLPKRDAFESVIFVGGGLRVENALGAVLAEYTPLPGDERNPLGNSREKTISFSLPVELIGRPERSWKYTVLIGAQDDHGGAGIGDFRNVSAQASEWSGGGKKRLNESNVYDVLLPQ